MEPPLHAGNRPGGGGRLALVIVLVVALFAAATVAGLWNRIFSQITSIQVGGVGQSGEPVDLPTDLSAGRALNILVIGTDDRSGGNAAIGGEEEGVRGDVTILVHIDADRSQVRMTSIPRDLMVDIPSCASKGMDPSPAGFGQFNTAFSTGWGQNQDMAGAVTCVMSTVRESTGILPDAAMVLDFQAVVGVVDALGGVEVCGKESFEPEGVGDFRLNAGCHRLDGAGAIQFLRARHVGGDGSDLARISRQQCFMRQASRQALSGDLLSQVTKVYTVADVLAANTTLTDNLASTSALTGLLYSLRSLPAGAVTTVSPPLADWDVDPNRVVWGAGAADFWRDFSSDAVQRQALAAQSAAQQSGTATAPSPAGPGTGQDPQTPAPPSPAPADPGTGPAPATPSTPQTPTDPGVEYCY
ncbi:LCP family protein [Schaalia sp. 19OD2882]|uniref:LCP family protein n=1 Tax=Schaalia sp. 19OD2882 TaxID=2794089 RepID=UPI001C1F18F6|nr:LCP family protein [Schaalia sp. 19OD2882]QWW18928.1 LCP family protein [Schaalia sp. 19OD2882]